METTLKYTRELRNAINEQDLQTFLDMYLKLYNQLQIKYEGKEQIHSLIIDLLFEELETQRDEQMSGRLGV
jgi:hypothetical protein